MFKQAEYSTDSSEKVKCFICDNLLTDTTEWINVLQSRTKYSNTDFCTMIGQLIGTSFLVYITTSDYVCARCDRYINKADKFLDEISKCKEILSEFARKKYDGSKNDSKTLVEDISNSEIVLLKNDFNCILCDYRTYTLELLQKHIQSHDYKTINVTPDTPQTPDIEYRCCKCTSKFYNVDDMNSHISECINTPKMLNEISITPIEKTKPDKLVKSSNSTTENESSSPEKDSFPKSPPSNPKSALRTLRIKQRRKSNLNTEDHKTDVLEHSVESQLIEYDPVTYTPAPIPTASRARYMRNELYVCHICKYKTYNQESMRKHIRIHRQDYVECLICKKLFKNIKTLRRHLSSHTSVICDVCNKEFRNTAVYNAHVMLHHPKQKIFESDLKTNTVELSLGSDMLIEEYIDSAEDNSNASQQFCIVCGIIVTGDDHTCNSFVSEAIDESGDAGSQIENVQKNYDNSDPFCQYCGKEITPPQKLKEHERRHIKFERLNLQCPNCPKKFRTQTGLDYHMAKHTGNYKTYCEICNKGFMSLKFLEEHKGVHTKEDRYVCDVCGRKFCYNSTYRMHRLWHDNPMPYECNICGEKFSHSSIRKLHIRRVHTGERPYTCQYCDKSFLRATVLTKHIMQHTQEFRFRCEPCNKGFTTRQKYGLHLAKIHRDPSLLTKTECQYKMALKPSEKNIQNDSEQEQSEDAIFLDPNNIYTLVDNENVQSENLQHITTQNYFEGFKYEIITDATLQEYIVMAEGQINVNVDNQNIIVET